MPFSRERYVLRITIAEVERYKHKPLKTVTPSTVHEELDSLKAMLNRAVA